MRKVVSVLTAGLIATATLMVACHADDDDPEGQAKELSDPVRRANAIANLTRIYQRALDCCEKVDDECKTCERSHPKVKEIADTIHAQVTKTYVDNEELHATRTGHELLKLMNDMRDVRTLPALIAALDWDRESSEQHAITAAKTIRKIEVPDGQVDKVVEKLGEALERVDSNRGVDNQMRVAFIKALGDLRDGRTAPVLTKVMTTQSEKQDLLINRLAAQQLSRIAGPEQVPAFVEALFLFDSKNPGKRMNDVAAEALVRIGKPALAPLVEVLQGKHEKANAVAKSYIAAIKERNEEAAAQMSVVGITSSEATYALGALGFRDALDPLLAEIKRDDIHRRINAAIALVRLNHEAEDRPKVRDALKKVYEAVGSADDMSRSDQVKARAQLTAAMRHMYSGELLSYMLKQAKDTDMHPVVRLEAVKAYALLANKAEQKALRTAIEKDDSGYEQKFAEYVPALDAAKECDEDLGCWSKKLASADDELQLKKAAYMLGRIGRNNDAAIKALVEKLDHREVEVRLAAVQALDRVAAKGSEAAIEKIEQLRQKEEGRSIWTQFSREALPIQARLRSRAA